MRQRFGLRLKACHKSDRKGTSFPVAFCVKPHASPCAPLRSIGNRNGDASLHSAIPSLRSLRIPLSAPTLRATAQSMPQKRQERNKVPLSLFVSSPMPRLEPQPEALAASCRPCTNFELSIINFMGCLTCFTLEIICDIINQNKPVEKGVALWQSI